MVRVRGGFRVGWRSIVSKIRKTIGLDMIGIESLSLPEKDKEFFRKLIANLELMHRNIRDFADAGGFQTKIWRGLEDSSGHFIIQERIDGVWTNSGFRLKKA